jgi:pheromone a factor receptor
MPDYPFTTATGVATLLCIPIAYFTFKSASHPLATSLLIGWIFIENLLFFVDSIIWSGGNPDEWWDGKIYCDINSRVKSVWMIGVPGAAIGMCRFLADATKSQAGDEQGYLKKRRRNLIDFTLGILLPLLNAGLKFIVNPQRYSIIGVQGCIGLTQPVWLAFPLYYLWTPILSFVAAVYAGTIIIIYVPY